MRRTIFLALLAALLIVPAARAAGTDPIEIQRDCADDGLLQGNYTTSELRKARDELPTDADEYSDCRDVLSRAISAKTASSNSGGGDDSQSSGGGGGSTGGGGGSGTSDPAPAATPRPKVATDPGIETGPVTQQDWAAVAAGVKDGERGAPVNGRDVSPMLAANVGRNGLPTTLLVALALLGGAVLAALLMPLRRRVSGHRT